MGNSPDDTRDVIAEKFREYHVPAGDIAHILGEETKFVFLVRVMKALAEIDPKLTLALDQARRRKWESDYIKKLRALSTLWKSDSIISRLGLSSDDLSLVINDLSDRYEQLKKGRASSEKALKNTASYVFVALRGLGLGQTQAIDFVYHILKDTAAFKGLKQVKDRIRKWDEETWSVLKKYLNKST